MTAPSLVDLERERHPRLSERALVERVAGNVIAELGITVPPVDVAMVASYLDIARVVLDEDLDAAGCLVCRPSGIEIRVRSTDAPARQRFTTCHECGHTFFPGFERVPRYRCAPAVLTSKEQTLEALCDAAASALLLPDSLFRTACDAVPFGFDGLDCLGSEFGASLIAVAYRWLGCSSEPTAVLSFDYRPKPSDGATTTAPVLRLQSAAVSGQWPYFLRHKSVEGGDVFDRAAQGELVHEVTTVRGICTKPVQAEVHARLAPFYDEHGTLRRRVLALLRRPVSRRG